MKYIKEEIPQNLIDECNKLSEENNEIYYIFDNQLEDDEIQTYFVGNINDFNTMPSRFSYYDSEMRIIGRWERYNHVINFIKKIGLEDGLSNFGGEFEQSFFRSFGNSKIILRIKPNLNLTLIYNDENGDTKYTQTPFSKSKVLKWIKSLKNKNITITYRDMLIDEILS